MAPTSATSSPVKKPDENNEQNGHNGEATAAKSGPPRMPMLPRTISPSKKPSRPRVEGTPPKKPYLTISVDGNISSGKSTLVSTLIELFPKDFNLAVEAVPEPLEKWTNMKGHNLLEMLYQDTTANNFLFQHYVQLTRLDDTTRPSTTEDEDKGNVRIMERSIQNNRYCFSELARREGTLHEAEFSVIAEWYKWLEENTDLPLDLIIYLQTSPQVVFERMQTRGRSEESTVPLQYLSALHDTYEDWLIHEKIDEGDSPRPRRYQVIVIDANKGRAEVAEECKERVTEFLNRKLAQEKEDAEKKKMTNGGSDQHHRHSPKKLKLDFDDNA